MEEYLIIGIDPDVDKSGFAIWNRNDRSLQLLEFDLTDLFDQLISLSKENDILIYLESGHIVKKYWHSMKPSIAKNVGANNEIGSQIEKFLKKHNITHRLIKPAGYSKYTHKEFCKITGWPVEERTNNEKRAAGLMVYGL